MNSKLTTSCLLLALALVSPQVRAAQAFVIEAEDFDYEGGQHVMESNVMPYYGGAYESTGPAWADVDYQFEAIVDSPDFYRYGEVPNVPMVPENASLTHGDWDVVVNYKIGWISTATRQWFNYTRDFPPGEYRVYAALSYGDALPEMLQAQLGLVTGGTGTPAQTIQPLATLKTAGSGGWGTWLRVPFLHEGQPVVLALDGSSTFRFTAISGDFDYLLFVPKDAPYATVSLSQAESAVGDSVTLSATVTGLGPFTYQWRRDGTDVVGATGPALTLNALTMADTGMYSVRVSDPYGSWASDAVALRAYFPLHVGDTVAPDQPVAGAGIWPGTGMRSEHLYKFDAKAGDTLYVEQLGDWDPSLWMYWYLVAPSGLPIYSQEFGWWYNGAIGASFVLPESGSYRLTVYEVNGSPGTYSFRLGSPAQTHFDISLGAHIVPNVPAEGAGIVDPGGVLDVFHFELSEPTAMFFNGLYGGYGCTFGGLHWALFDPDGGLLFLYRSGYCASDGPVSLRLAKPGAYTLVVAGGWNEFYEYSFALTGTTIQDHYLLLGDTVALDQPDVGSGVLESPGAVDYYSFDITAPQSICILETFDSTACTTLTVELQDPQGKGMLMSYLDDGCYSDGLANVRELTTVGTYKLTVSAANGNAEAAGAYSFQLLPTVGVQKFDLALDQLVELGTPAPGAGFLDPNAASDEFTIRMSTDGFVTFEDLLSTDGRLQFAVNQVGQSWPFLGDVLDGVSQPAQYLPAGVYQLVVSAVDPHDSGAYKLRVSTLVNQSPVALCKDVVLPAWSGSCIAYVGAADVDNGSYDPEGGWYYAYIMPSGYFEVGTSPVTLVVYDAYGGWATCEATVTIQDVEPPLLNCPQDMTVETEPGSCSARVDFPIFAYDPCGFELACDPPPGSEFPKGTTATRCVATDRSGLSAECSFTITVVDHEAPTVAIGPWSGLGNGKRPQWFELSAADNCDGVAIYVQDSASDFVAGPFQTGDGVKFIHDPTAAPRTLPGPPGLAAQVRIAGDALVYSVDASGNRSAVLTVSR